VLPPIGSQIRITYAVTSGSVGNNGGSNLDVSLQSDATITGKTSSSITGGADEKPAAYYKLTAPYLFRARSRAVTTTDYKAIATSYPGIACVVIQSQRDIAPKDLRWMNVVRVCILPEGTDFLTTTQWNAFEDWFKSFYHAAIKIQRYNPTKVIVDVEVTLALKVDSVPADIVPVVEISVTTLFSRGYNTLGKRIAISDIVEASMVTGVDYVQVVNPVTDLVTATPLHYFELDNLKINVMYTERNY
jgi:hypothetical protein